MAQTTESHSFQYFMESELYARNSVEVIDRILHAQKNITVAKDKRLAISGFPETGRFIWLMPMRDGQTAVIEAPGDDSSPYTMLSALTSNELWRWSRVDSPNYTTKVENLCSTYSIALPNDPDAYKPATFSFPAEWVNAAGKTRTGMQIHCILSRNSIATSRRLDPPQSPGAVCTCIAKPGAINKPASKGCAFVSRSSHFNGLSFSDGLANTVFGDSEGGRFPEAVFNFTDKQFNDAAYSSYADKTILVLLHAFTSILRNQVERPITITFEE